MPIQFNPDLPFSPVDAALTGTAPANPASPIDAALAAAAPKPAPAAPATPAAPVFDPAAPYTPLADAAKPGGMTFDPSATFKKEFTPDDIRNQSVEALDKESDLEPSDFGLQHEAELNSDPALKEKLLEIYKRRSQDFRDLKDLVHEATSHPLKSAGGLVKGGFEVLGSVAKGVGQLASNVNQAINPFVPLAGMLGGSTLNEELNKSAGAAAEIPISVEANITGLQSLVRKSIREVAEKAAAIDPTGFVRDMTGAKSKSELTAKEWRARFEDDVAGKKAVVDAVRGQGYLMQALGLNADELKDAGITIRPEVVAKLQPATDPLNFILLGEGGAVGAVGKVGGRFVIEEVAQAATREQASVFARGLNAAAEAAGKTTTAAGEGVEKLGDLLRDKVFKPLGHAGDVASGVTLGTLGLVPAAKVAIVTKGSAKALNLVGQGLQFAGKAIPSAARLGADIGIEGAKGFGEGLLLTAPFTVGADPTEREGLLHAAALGGLARAGVRAGGLAAKAVAIKAQEKLGAAIFKEVEQAPAPPAFEYGTEPALDAAHAAQIAQVPPVQQKFVGWIRGLLKDSGVEVYLGDEATFKNQVGTGNAFGSAVKIGQTVAADGAVKPLVRVFLNANAEALPHEAFHALELVDAPGTRDFVTAVNKSLRPEERKYFENIYNTLLNDGKPPSKWTRKLSPEGISQEIAAEVFSRVILGQDLSGVAPTLRQKAAVFASGILEKAGVPLGNVEFGGAGPGRSTLGIKPKAAAVKAGRQFVENFLGRIKERGNVLPETPETSALTGGKLEPGEISRVKPGAPPSAPTPATPAAPTPKGPVIDIESSIVPSKPAPKLLTNPPLPKAKNIRTSTEKQNDFAAKRAEVTKIDAAKEAAAKTGDANTIARVDEISKSVESGNPVLEIEHSGVKNEAAAPTGRTNRRTEQEAAYIAEGLGAAPAEVRDLHQKTFSFVRWEVVNGKPQLLAMSLDKVIANVHRAVKEAVSVKKETAIPYEVKDGKLTDAAWNDVVRDLQSYAENQSNGYRGDGGKLVRPIEDIGLSIPAENPSYNPVQISEPKANFLNLVQGLNPPLTAREVGAGTPGNVKGQILAELNARTPEKPAVIRPQDIQKQTFKSGREVMETNPLRNELAAAGAKVRELIEVTERINAEDIQSVKPRPDINFKAPVTDTIRGGLLPGGPEFFKHNTVEEIGAAIQKANPEEWQKLATDMGSLTQGAYKLGVNLKDAADVGKLREFEAQSVRDYEAAKANKDFDAMFPAATKKQFFTEALETATGMSPSKKDTIGRILGKDWEPPFPEAAKGKLLPGAETDAALRQGLLPDPKTPKRETDKSLADIASKVAAASGIDYKPSPTYAPLNLDLGKKLANFYDKVKSDPTNPEVKTSYAALLDETWTQYQSLVDAGYKFEPFTGKGEPYKSSAEAVADIRDNKHLFVLPTEGNFAGGKDNPMLASSGVEGLPTVNDIFRGVHDVFGHAKEGYQFGPRGEFNAWRAHSEMYSPEAQGALAAETLAQNSWVNFGPHLEGKEVPASKRPFAEQKAVVVPQDLIDEARGQLLPKGDSPEAVDSAAIRDKETGEIFSGETHGAAMRAASAAAGIPKEEFSLSSSYANPNYEQGFVTKGGDFLTRSEARKRVEEVGQISPEDIKSVTQFDKGENMESVGFEHRRKFQPKTDAGRALEKKGFELNIEPNETDTIVEVVARKAGIPVGIVTATMDSPTKATIHDITVNPDIRRRGVGEALYRELAAELQAKGVKKVDGIIVSADAIRRRAKVFPDTTVTAGGRVIPVSEAEAKLRRGEYLSNVESKITPDIKFMPRSQRDEQGRPLKPDGTVDFARFFKEDPEGWAKDQEERQSSVQPGEEITWPVTVANPQTQLTQKEPLPNSVGGKLRLIHYSNNNDLKRIDPKFIGRAFATPTDLSGGDKSFFFVEGSGIGSDAPFFAGANKYGVVVDGNSIYDYANDPQGFRQIRNREEQDDAIKAAGYSGIRTQTRDGRDVVALYKSVVPVPLPKSPEQKFMPGTSESLPGLNAPSEDKAQQQIRSRVSGARKQYPEALSLKYKKDADGKFIVAENGLGKPETIEYDLLDSPLAASAAKGIRGDEARQAAFEKALGDRLAEEGAKALENPEIEAGRKWYSTARTRLKGLFGEDTKLFTELLAATSPRTGVDINYKFALDAYNQFKQGKFDSAIRKYQEGKTAWDKADLKTYQEATGNKNPTRAAFLDWWIESNDISPVQANGKKYGMNSRPVLRVLDGSWAETVSGPKTPNFQGNLAGTTFEATIDIWAARALHRLAHEGSGKPWRILPLNETGVIDKDFYIGQAAYRHAAKKLNMKPDALQALLWFNEKQHWNDRGWTGSQGAEKSDYNALLKDTKSEGGILKIQSSQKGLDFTSGLSEVDFKKK